MVQHQTELLAMGSFSRGSSAGETAKARFAVGCVPCGAAIDSCEARPRYSDLFSLLMYLYDRRWFSFWAFLFFLSVENDTRVAMLAGLYGVIAHGLAKLTRFTTLP